MQCLYGDDAVRATNDDASDCKRCAVNLGYWADRYISLFIKAGERKAPEINRGYYARTRGVGLLVEAFIKRAGSNCQIINFGAGFDTLYWRLKDLGLDIKNFIELDFPNVTAKKCCTIKRNKILLEKIHTEDGEVRFSPTDLHAAKYHLAGVDLRYLNEVKAKLNESEVDWTAPTLLLAECVLVYMEPESSRALLSMLASNLQCAYFINYEQINMEDRFAQIMLSNLRSRGCALAGVEACRDLASQQQSIEMCATRVFHDQGLFTWFLDAGWQGAKAWTMEQVWASLPREDRERVERLEFLDEQELLQQLFQHYCISVGWIDHGNEPLNLADIEWLST